MEIGRAMRCIFLTAAVFFSQTYALTDPLPKALIEPFSVSVRCPAGKVFQWKRADNTGLDLIFYYTCGGGGEMSQTLHCTNGYKATYRRDLIPESMKKAAIPMAVKRGQIASLSTDPDFGLFATGPDFSMKNGAVVVFACLNPNK